MKKEDEEAQDVLPKDILIEILTKLPARCLSQLRWVCKNWHGLISDPSFVNMHYHKAIAINHPLLVISHSNGRPRLYRRPLVDETTRYELRYLGSCNGLLCISIVAGIHMRIWNPCTREFKDVPSPPPLSDPHLRAESYGFGYDNISNDYKIVRNTCFCRLNDLFFPYYSLVDVYTLGTDSWKRINCNFSYKPLMNYNGVLVNGSLYWLTRKSGVLDTMIIGFDIANEEYREISVPQTMINNETHYIQLTELEGCLCIVAFENFKKMDVWRMKDCHVNKEELWSKLFTVKEPIIDCENRGMSFKVLRICKNGEVLVVMGSRDLVLYNPNIDRTRFITEIPYIREKWELKVVETCTCIESLVSLNSGTYMGTDLEEEDKLQFRILPVSSTSIDSIQNVK